SLCNVARESDRAQPLEIAMIVSVRSFLRASMLISLLATPTLAAADTEAERLFNEARALMQRGAFDEACPTLAESQRIEPRLGTLRNLAACHERQGKSASAWVEYQKALTAARAEGHAERARLAEERIRILEPRVPWLAVSAPPDAPEGLEITLDGG